MFCNHRSKTLYKAHHRQGFTLVELMVVIVIIGLLSATVTVSVRSYLIKAKRNVVKLDLSKICHALDVYYTEYDRYPSDEKGLSALTEKTSEMVDGFLPRVPKDPWGRSYHYLIPGRQSPYEVVCLGADGREGGEGTDMDVSSHDTEK